MLIYLDRGHRTDGGAPDEWRQVGVFVDELESLLTAAGLPYVRTPDALDSFEAQSWVLDREDEFTSALYLACHANVGASRGLTFYNPTSTEGTHAAYRIAHEVDTRCYCTVPLSVRTAGYERTGGTIARITASPRPICGVLLELWSVSPTPTDDAIREVASAVAAGLVS
jgi:hypothetical protein